MMKKKPPPAGAPEWVLTYGDMMSLLLCFFILLSAFANFEEAGVPSQKAMAAIQSIQKALGIKVPAGNLQDEQIDFNTIIEKLQKAIEAREDKEPGDSREQGMYGKTFRLRRIRDGMEVTIGGSVTFEPFSDQITAEGKEALASIGEVLKGHRNRLEIRGHAGEEPRPADWTLHDAMTLSFARAQRVADELILGGVDPRAVRLVAAGANEPVAREVYDPAKRSDNRRVEIIVRESQIDDYVGQTPAGGAAPPAAAPAAAAP